MNKVIVLIVFSLMVFGCKNNSELAMERGIQYYEWDMIEKSIIEFKFVIHSLNSNKNKLDYNKIELLSRAYHNLAIAYAKKGWYENAISEARNAFDLFPTDKNKKVLELIKSKKKNSSN